LVVLGIVLLVGGAVAGFLGKSVDDSAVVSVLLGGGLAMIVLGALLHRISKLTLPGDIAIELSPEAEKKVEEKAKKKAEGTAANKDELAARAVAALAKEYWGRVANPSEDALEPRGRSRRCCATARARRAVILDHAADRMVGSPSTGYRLRGSEAGTPRWSALRTSWRSPRAGGRGRCAGRRPGPA